MAKVTNNANGPRGVFIRGVGGPEHVILQPGETREDLKLFGLTSPAMRAMQDSGELDFHGATADAEAEEAKVAKDAEEARITAEVERRVAEKLAQGGNNGRR